MPYFLTINIIFVFIWAFFCSINVQGNFNRNVFLFLCFFQLVYVHSMVGVNSVPDLYTYEHTFNNIRNASSFLQAIAFNTIKQEAGFSIYMWLVSLIYSDYRFFLIINSAILLLCYLFTFKRYSNHLLISVLLLLLINFNQSIYVLRQHLVIAILLYAIRYIISKQLIKYLLVCGLAFSFHQTALISIPIYFIYNIKSNKRFIFIMFLIGIVLFFTIKTLLPLVGMEYFIGYSSYLDENKQGMSGTQAIIQCCFLLCYIFCLRKHIFDEGINRLILTFSGLSVILTTCGIGFVPISRLVMYYSVINILLVPRCLDYLDNKYLKICLIISVLTILFYQYYNASNMDNIKDAFLVNIT